MMWARALCWRGWLWLVPLGTAAAVALAPAQARAQSAADKATARQLAVSGIKLYDEGRYNEALDSLQRAQALFDAPVHLLYIARCQHKLGQLVESAETYRRLDRVQLDAGAPTAFVNAKRNGEKELAILEPTVPVLKVLVDPPNVQGLMLTIDGQPVSAAVIGIDRPINPGQHRVEVSAPGYAPAASTVAIGKSDKKETRLLLQPATGAVSQAQPAPGQPQEGTLAQPGAVAQPVAAPTSATPERPAAAEEPEQRGGVGFLLGARLGGMLPVGGFDSGLDEAFPAGHRLGTDSLSFSDVVGGGIGLEVQGGLRFAKYYTVFLSGGFYGLKGRSGLDDLGFEDADYNRNLPPEERPLVAETMESVPTMLLGGVGLRLGTERGQYGGFGEAAFTYHALNVSQQVTFANAVQPDCTIDRTYAGGAFRLGGGAVIPASKALQLTPFASASIGSFGSAQVRGACLDEDYSYDPGGDMHVLLMLGVGGDLLLGSDAPTQ